MRQYVRLTIHFINSVNQLIEHLFVFPGIVLYWPRTNYKAPDFQRVYLLAATSSCSGQDFCSFVHMQSWLWVSVFVQVRSFPYAHSFSVSLFSQFMLYFISCRHWPSDLLPWLCHEPLTTPLLFSLISKFSSKTCSTSPSKHKQQHHKLQRRYIQGWCIQFTFGFAVPQLVYWKGSFKVVSE